MRKLISWLLAAAILLTLLPTAAFAANPQNIIFSGNGDWQDTTVRADNTKDYTIEFDVSLPLIAGVTATNTWADEGKIIIRNESTNEYIYFRVMAFRNGSGQYQIASAANVWSGSDWSGEDFLWSGNYATPLSAVHMKIDYSDGAYSWAVTSTDGSVAICSGEVTSGHLREGILTCTSAEIRFYRNSTDMTVSNGVLTYAEETTCDIIFTGNGDWQDTTVRADNTKDYTIEFDVSLPLIAGVTATNTWADEGKIIIRNESTDEYIYFRVMAFRNGSGQYQIASAANVWSGSGWSGEDFLWSGSYATPFSAVHMKIDYRDGEYSWTITSTDGSVAICSGAVTPDHLRESILTCTSAQIRFYRNSTDMTVSNGVLTYVEETTGDFIFTGNGDWQETTVRADNTKDYTIDFDVSLPMIAGVTGTDAWGDEGKIIIRNEPTDEYIYFRVMTYRNGGGQYQIASAANVWSGSSWSGEDFLWSSGYETPFTAVHVKINYKGGAYSWAVTSTDGSVAICSGAVTPDHLREGILTCTSAQIRFYRNSNNMTVSNAKLRYSEATLQIVSAALRLDEDIDVIYTVNVPKGYTNPYMVINGVTISDSVVSGKYRLFTYTGITPQKMTDNISATLYAAKKGVTESDTVASYSVKQYCANLLSAHPDDTALVTLLSDLLTYGAAAQNYTNYNINSLATDGLTLAPSTFAAISGKSVSFTGTADAGTYWSEATLTLGNTVGIRLFFYTDAQISIDVTINDSTESYDSGFVSCGNGKYYLDIPGIEATDFDTTVTAEFYDNGMKIGSTLGYSVNAYICGKQNSENTSLRSLVRALYNYGVSAANYRSLQTPYLDMARSAVDDIITNWWDPQIGRVKPTWGGYPTANLPDQRGGTWEAAMLLFNIYNMWVLTGEDAYKQYLTQEAAFYRTAFSEAEMEFASGNMNWASDDCGWNCLWYLCLYNVTGDYWFVERAIGLSESAAERWYDAELNGLYYKDNVDFMSLYETALCLSWLRIWEITGEQHYYDLAFRSYSGMEARLSTEEGIYFCEANKISPRGTKGDINEAGSTSFLAGNMAMAALHAIFYRITGDSVYLDRMYNTNNGLLDYYDNNGVLLNDRDAWTNGTFAAIYVSEVLSLPNTEQMQQLIYGTAESIYNYDRTSDGYYGGCWSGPAEGPQSRWEAVGSTARQSMTTGTAVLMIVAGALLESGIDSFR